jgi:hypothetical protein
MRLEIQEYSGFHKAEKAERDYCAALTHQERLDLLLELIRQYQESVGEAAEGFERVYRVVELSRS